MLKPKLPSVPGISVPKPELPTPELPKAPSTGDVLDAAGVPGVPDMPTAPSAADVLNAAGVPGMPEVPTAASVAGALAMAAAASAAAAASVPPGMPDVAEIQRLAALRESGQISDEEYAAAIQKLVGGSGSGA
jgi:hypothetical protein